MNKIENPIRKYVIVQFVFVAIAACVAAFSTYHLIAEEIPNRLFVSERYEDYWNEQLSLALEDFQNYVTENSLTKKQAAEQSWWYSSGENVRPYFDALPFLDPENSEHRLYLIENNIFTLNCSDGNIFATSYSPGNAYRRRWNVRGMVSGTICAIIILFSYVFHLLHRIKSLYKQILYSTQKDGDVSIDLRGQDELAELAKNIESMRCSLLELLEQEQESKKSQTQLIATLSHDIRTPLTKLMGYLDILRYKKAASEKDKSRYLELANEKAEQLKNLTDELLSCVFVKGKIVYDDRKVVNGSEFLSQMLYEYCYELEAKGFKVDPPTIEGDYTLNLSVDSFQRICDNICSNIIKYADKNHPVSMKVSNGEDSVYIKISNCKADRNSYIPHHGLGLPSMRELTEYLGGTLSITDTKEQFEVCLSLPKTNLHTSKQLSF